MKKRLLMLVAAAFLIFGVALISSESVNATPYTDMNYDQVVAFWSTQPAFTQVYLKEAALSPYTWDVKADITKYFKASLTEYCVNPGNMQATRPLTYGYMQGVIMYSNPLIYQVIVSGNHAWTLQEALLDEINKMAPYLDAKSKSENVAILTSYLNHQGVYTVDQYNVWKERNGGMTAFEVYCHQIKDASDAWTQSIKDASAAQAAYNQQFIDNAYEQQQAMNEQIQQDTENAMQQQQEQYQQMMEQMMGN